MKGIKVYERNKNAILKANKFCAVKSRKDQEYVEENIEMRGNAN